MEQAIERSARLIRFYVGKGAVPYGDHHPWIPTHEDNGKCGMAAVLFNLLGDAAAAEFFSRMSVASHGAERDGGHTFTVLERQTESLGVLDPDGNPTARLDVFKAADVARLSVTNALGAGSQGGYHEQYRGADIEVNLLKKVRLEIEQQILAPMKIQ